ncbi:MAG TPA: phosphoribosylanthranilate isomerase [Gammaproteobacteria bacterium]|nr:phosphoribosylanthranilate isomerase [Gammaproteobacteria bacterium]
MRRTRVKVCGITRSEDARDAVGLGVDALGLVFYPPSARYLSPGEAAHLVRGLPPFVTTVGLFLDPEPGFVNEVLERVPLDLLQFHGRESPAQCEQAGRPYIKAIAMGGGADPEEQARRFASARGLLVDSHVAGAPGGSGRRFDWRAVGSLPDGPPLILAGGLTPENVGEAIRVVRPWAVDVSSGVEDSPGLKSPVMMRRFMEAVADADDR